jgi:hypothetical protein
MLTILVQAREAAPRLNRARLQRAPQVVPSTFDAQPRREGLPQMPVAVANTTGQPSPHISRAAPLSIGSLLYLGSLGLVAAGIVAVFFGAGFSMLVLTGGVPSSGSANRAGPEIMSLPYSLGNVEQHNSSVRRQRMKMRT